MISNYLVICLQHYNVGPTQQMANLINRNGITSKIVTSFPRSRLWCSSWLSHEPLGRKHHRSKPCGSIFFALALTQLGGGLLAVGSPNTLLKVIGADLGSSWKRINQAVSVVLKAVIGLTIVSIVIALSASGHIAQWLGMPELAPMLPVIALAMGMFALVQILAALLQGKQNTVLASTVQNVIAQFSFVVISGILVLFTVVQTSFTLIKIYLISLSFSVLLGAWYWFSTAGTTLDIRAKFSPELKSSLSSLFVAMLMGMCVEWAGQFATAKYLSSSDVAFLRLPSALQRSLLLFSLLLT